MIEPDDVTFATRCYRTEQMELAGPLVAAGTLGLMGWAMWGRGFVGRKRSTRLFTALLRNASVDARTGAITGTYEGSELTVRFAKRVRPWDTGNTAATDCIEVVLEGLPEELRLALSHRPGNVFRPGWVATCNTGDARFDRSFWVEGAPVVWIAAMHAPDVRAWLLDDHLVWIVVENGVLVWTRFTFFSDASAAESVLSHLLELRAKALELRTRAIETKMSEAASSGYRGNMEEAATHALDPEKEQAAQFVRDRDARRESGRRRARIFQFVMLTAMVALYAWWWSRQHR